MGRRLIDISGKKYNHLTVLYHDVERSTNKKHFWICKCDCGKIKSIEGARLKNGETKACGCLRGGVPKYKTVNKKLYKKWSHMKDRCYSKNDISYKNYGARGIKVCDEWLENFDNFAEWSLKNGYNEKLELDRINVNGNYEPNNCRYVSRLVNSRNKRNTLKYEYDGKQLTLKEIAEINNIQYKLLWQRINRDKLSLEEAIY